jgi:hypothetical protein
MQPPPAALAQGHARQPAELRRACAQAVFEDVKANGPTALQK